MHNLVGKQAPPFSLPNHDGEIFTFTPGQDGIPAVIFFYPKSGTYGCTREACGFRDAIAEKDNFKSDKALVIGISSDPVEKQKEFVDKQKLTYPILSDANGEVHKTFHVGKGLFGLVDARITFIVDAKGTVRDALDTTLNFGAHVKFVSSWLDKLEKETITDAPTPESDPTKAATAS